MDWEAIHLDRGENARTRIEVEVARRLAACLRAEDALGRARSDTFVLLLRGCPSDQLAGIAERCGIVIQDRPFDTEDAPIRLSSACATTLWEGDDAGAFIDRASADIEGSPPQRIEASTEV
jgi:GGDEF domain-containing protein